jgi:hypothetical protein
MFRDAGRQQHPDNRVQSLSPEELRLRFDTAVMEVSRGIAQSRELLTVSRDNFGHYNVHSQLAPLGSCSQIVLDSVFGDFIRTVTGEDQKQLLDSAFSDPDKKTHEMYYDKLDNVFGIPQDNAAIGLSVLADERGILSATWSIQRTDTAPSGGLKVALKQFATIFSRR